MACTSEDIMQQRWMALHNIPRSYRECTPELVSAAVTKFCTSMVNISTTASLKPAHLSVLVESIATVGARSALASAATEQQQNRSNIHTCLSSVILRVAEKQPHLNKLGSRTASDVLHACAVVSLNPDTVLPGIASKLLRKVAYSPAKAVPSELAGAVWAIAELECVRPLSQKDTAAAKYLCMQFVALINKPKWRSVKPQHVSDVIWAMAALSLQPKASAMEKLCSYLVAEAGDPATYYYEPILHIANALWAWNKVGFQPDRPQMQSIISQLIRVTLPPRTKTEAQELSTAILAAAGLYYRAQYAIKHLADIVMQSSKASAGDLCNIAWALAAADALTPETLGLV